MELDTSLTMANAFIVPVVDFGPGIYVGHVLLVKLSLCHFTMFKALQIFHGIFHLQFIMVR